MQFGLECGLKSAKDEVEYSFVFNAGQKGLLKFPTELEKELKNFPGR